MHLLDSTQDLFYPCHLNNKYITSCPEIYSDWQLSKDCERSPTSFVYENNNISENYYCAIWHLADRLQYFTLLPSSTYTNLTEHIADFEKRFGDSSHTTRFSYETNQCRGKCPLGQQTQCMTLNERNSIWGSLSYPTSQACMAIPFDVTCTTNMTALPSSLRHNQNFEHLCANTVLQCESITGLWWS